MSLASKFNVLRRWHGIFRDWKSLWKAHRLLRSGRDRDNGTDNALVDLGLRSIDNNVYCRLGTSDFTTLLEVFAEGEYASVAKHVLQPVSLVVDLGLNIGMASLYLSTLFPESRYVGVEPAESNIQIAKRNLGHLARRGKLNIYRGFIGGSARTAVIDPRATRNNEYRMTDTLNSSGTAIPVITMPWLLKQENVSHIDLLKCDIEGAERELFGNCRDWIRNVTYLVIELHDGLDEKWLAETIKENGARFECLQTSPGYAGAFLVTGRILS